jgi:Uncharacterized membrane protein, required for colicin V production
VNLIDFVVLVVAVWLGARGFVKGLLKEALEAASALAGVVVASKSYQPLGDTATLWTGLPPDVTRPVLYAAVAVSVTALGFFITNLVHAFFPRQARARSFDGYGGLIFGVLKGLFFSGLLVVVAAQIPSASIVRALDGSVFGRAVFALTPVLYRQIGS